MWLHIGGDLARIPTKEAHISNDLLRRFTRPERLGYRRLLHMTPGGVQLLDCERPKQTALGEQSEPDEVEPYLCVERRGRRDTQD